MTGPFYFLDFSADNDWYFAETAAYSPDDLLTLSLEGDSLADIGVSIGLPKARGRLIEHLSVVPLTMILRDDVIAVLQHHDAHVEAFPVKVDRATDARYWFANIVGHVEAVDNDASGVTYGIPGIRVYSHVAHLRLDGAAVGDRHVFRLSTLRTHVVVSDDVRQALQALPDVTSMRFVPCDGFVYPVPMQWNEVIDDDGRLR
mgnify:CR=1 FL=1